jgi:hypothetical protein
MKKLPGLAGIAVLVIIVALLRIGSSVYDYEIFLLDRDAPTISTKPSPIPAPHKPHNDFPTVRTPVEPAPPCYASGDPCKAREQVFI